MADVGHNPVVLTRGAFQESHSQSFPKGSQPTQGTGWCVHWGKDTGLALEKHRFRMGDSRFLRSGHWVRSNESRSPASRKESISRLANASLGAPYVREKTPLSANRSDFLHKGGNRVHRTTEKYQIRSSARFRRRIKNRRAPIQPGTGLPCGRTWRPNPYRIRHPPRTHRHPQRPPQQPGPKNNSFSRKNVHTQQSRGLHGLSAISVSSTPPGQSKLVRQNLLDKFDPTNGNWMCGAPDSRGHCFAGE